MTLNRLPNLARPLLLLALLAALLPACRQEPAQPSTGMPPAEGLTLYTGARLLIGDGQVIEEGALLVSGDRLVEVGPVEQLVVPAGVTRIDLAGSTVMPAMIDAHAHLGYEGYDSWGADNYSLDTLLEQLNRYSYYGFSAVFSAGSDPDDFALDLQQAQQQGREGGARFVFAAGMAPPGQGPNDRFLEQALAVEARTGMTILRGLATPEQARAAAREVAQKGIGFIKIWVDDRGGSQEKLTPELYWPLMDEAKTLGLQVLVHQQYALDMPDLLDAGVDGFLHGRLGPELDRQLAAQIAASGAFMVPNLGLGELRRERVSDDPFLQETVAPAVLDRLGQAFDQRPAVAIDAAQELALQESMGHLLAAGVDVVLGTDAGAVPDHFFGYTGHRELEIFVRLGMSPLQAVTAATATPARRLGLVDLGTLEPGKRADFIVLRANPLDDIRNTRTIVDVYQAGQRLDREALRASWRLAGAR